MKNIMPKYDLKKIIHEMQDSPALKFFREIQDSPTMKTFREMQNSPAMKAFRETQDSPAMKAFREMQNSPAMKAFQEMQNSPAMKAFREMQNSPAMKALSAIRASQQKSLSSIFSKNLEGQLRLGNTLGALQQHSISSVFHERMIDYVSSQPIIQDLESANVPTTSNKDNLAVNSTTTTEEKNSASIITHIILWIFISICSSPVFKKLSVDAAFDLTIAFVFEYVIKPLADELIINDSETANCNNEPVANISNQETLNQFLANKRVVTNTIDFFESPKKKSSIIESLPAGTLLTVIPDKTISKSWLKVRITLDQNEVEGYVLRRYTSPVK
ncbi:hypothetical protein ACEQ85_12000 [Acinetobacter pittii]|uniref:hypothetical protein n=1 Tax=Acinetobacter pittii TaxID=48296 RepID=UPI0035A3D074